MKKIIIMVIMFAPIVHCVARINKDLSICITRLKPETKVPYDLSYKIYSVELELKNLSNKPILYWSWSCSWTDNFIMDQQEYSLCCACKDNMTFVELLLPKMKKRYSGTIYSKIIIKNKNVIKIGFKYFDAFIITRESYFDYWLKEIQPNKKAVPDTVWNDNYIKIPILRLW